MKGHMQDGKFHPHTQYKHVRSRRDKTIKPDGVRLQRESPLMVKGKINEKRLKNFWDDLSKDEKDFAVRKRVWKNLTKRDKLNLIEFEKNVTQITPDPKAELVKRGIKRVPAVKKFSDKEAIELLKDYEKSREDDQEDFDHVKHLVEEHFDYDEIKKMLNEQKIEDWFEISAVNSKGELVFPKPTKSTMLTLNRVGVGVGKSKHSQTLSSSSKQGKTNFLRFIDTGLNYEILNYPEPKTDDNFKQLEDMTRLLVEFLNGNLIDKINDRTYAYNDDGRIIVGQSLSPNFEEDNEILISKGILRKKRN